MPMLSKGAYVTGVKREYVTIRIQGRHTAKQQNHASDFFCCVERLILSIFASVRVAGDVTPDDHIDNRLKLDYHIIKKRKK